MITPEFLQSLKAGLRYWQAQTESNADDVIRRLDAEQPNIYRLVQYGRKVPELRRDTAVLALNAFYLVERKGYWLEWLSVFSDAANDWLKDEGDRPLKVQLLNRLGYLYQSARQLDEAVATHTQAEQIATDLQDTELLNLTWYYLCIDYRHCRQYEQAEKYGLLALTGFKGRSVHEKWYGFTLNELGLIAYHRGDLAQARQKLEKAAEIHRQRDRYTDFLRSLNNLIGVARAEKQYEQALAYYQEAVPYFNVISSEFDRAMLEIAMGGTLFEMGNYQEAEAAFRRANSPYLQRSRHVYQRALIWQCLGNTLLKQNRLDESERCLQESASLWADASDDLMLANTLGTLGELYAERKGMAKTAVSYLDQAISLLIKYPDDAAAVRLQEEFLTLKDSLVKA